MAVSQHGVNVFWAYSLSLQVNFEDEARIKFLKLLGFSKDELERKVFHLLYTIQLKLLAGVWHI